MYSRANVTLTATVRLRSRRTRGADSNPQTIQKGRCDLYHYENLLDNERRSKLMSVDEDSPPRRSPMREAAKTLETPETNRIQLKTAALNS